MDKQTFTSIQATTNTSRYAAAVFRKGKAEARIAAHAGLAHLLHIYGDCDGMFIAHMNTPLQGVTFD